MAKVILTGGGDWPPQDQQQQQMQQMTVQPLPTSQPKPDANWLAWSTGVLVPIVVAVIGVLAVQRKTRT